MKKLFNFFSFSITLFFSSFFFAQIPGLVNYSEEDGLNSSYTYMLNQDSKGFIWIGSDNGLFRFDGKEFKQYNKKNGLKNIDILSCNPLPNGEIFIMPYLSDFVYLKEGKIINSDHNKELKKLKFNHNSAAYTSGDSLFIYNTRDPKEIYVYRNGKVKSIPLYLNKKKEASEPRYVFTFDVHNHLLYLTDTDGKILAYNIFTKKTTICNISLPKSAIYRKSDFYISRHNNEINIYRIENKYYFRKIQSLSVNEKINYLVIDRNYRIWLCLDKGGVLYFKQSLLDNQKLSNPLKLMEGFVMNHVMIDRDNNVWFSTRNNGVYFITDKFFNNYIHLPVKNNSSYITAIARNGNNIILGYNEAKSGILNSNTITDLTFEKNSKIETKALFSKGNTIIFGMTFSAVQYNTLTHKTINLGNQSLKNVLPYTDDSVFICTSEALKSYNFVTHTFSQLLNERSYTALPYDKDSIFFGNFKDLYKLNTKTKKKSLFLEGYYLTDIKKLKSNVYIGATNLNGIIFFNNKKIIKRITEKDGLSTDQIKKIEVENERVFWASTNSGLSRIEITGSRLKINNFTQTDGLPSNVVAGCVIKEDTIYAATSKGLGILPISNLLAQHKFINKKVSINSVTVGNREIFNLNQKITGKDPDNTVTFDVSFPDFTSQGKIQFKYKIEGLSDEWQTGSSSRIVFNSIPPGQYVFKVFGLGYNGKQSYTYSSVAFEIKPRFWQTWWFKFLLISLACTLLFILITLYFQKKRNKKLEALYYEKKIAELELQAIKAQINPHFIYNCLNSIQFLLYKKDYDETENYLNTFAQMIRKTLHYSEKTFMPIKEEVEYLSLYLNMEKLRLKDQFDYKITLSKDTDEEWLIPSLLIQPFVENAIKHGISSLKDRKGNIEISFDYNGSSLCISIEDNGVGIGNSGQSITKTNSFGVKLSQKRIETFKQLFETHIILEINNLFEKQLKPGTQIKIYITPYENQNTSLHH
ncbi:sensor histidine kinase [Chryseobacterium populi]|uniref:Putative regulator of cell autolysis n=1 Tax=Chryseobacterium populi TaxID=1144316 RepID=J2JVC1_9FLAO|nr:histidine kinase [Chryseobacterium populi]EJL71825.1 putative regulator of cell autolysis [Chryseobacterium populi]